MMPRRTKARDGGQTGQHFEKAFDAIKSKYNAKTDTDVPGEGLRCLVMPKRSPISW